MSDQPTSAAEAIRVLAESKDIYKDLPEALSLIHISEPTRRS